MRPGSLINDLVVDVLFALIAQVDTKKLIIMLEHILLNNEFLEILHEIYGAWMAFRTTLSVLAPSVKPLGGEDVVALVSSLWHNRRLFDHLHNSLVLTLE